MLHRVLIIPAAGSGSRLGSRKPKFLTPVNGRAMVSFLLDLYRDAVEHIAVVVHPTARLEAEEELDAAAGSVRLFEQRHRTGMLDAILMPRRELETMRPLEVWITWCDQIAIRPETVERLAKRSEGRAAAVPTDLLFPTMEQKPPYIHLARDPSGEIIDVLHSREGDEMPTIGESDMGLFRLSDRAYFEHLPEYAEQAALGSDTGERNFLPFIPWLARRGRVETFPGHHPIEAVGINTPADLRRIEDYLRSGD